MSEIKFKEVTQPSSAAQLYTRAVFGSKSKTKGIPNIGIKGDLGSVEKSLAMPFLNICDYNTTTTAVPAVYLHILTHPYLMELLTSREFPYKLLGTIHISSKIKQLAPILFGDFLTTEVYFGESKTHDKGVIITVFVKIYRDRKLVWEEEMEFLKRSGNPKSSSTEKKEITPTPPIEGEMEKWILPSNLGRKYGTISGDINPIHLYPFTAKLFGFKRNIAHGVWTMARAMATIEQKINAPAYELYCAFKLPIFLPNQVQINYKMEKNEIDFEVRDKNNTKPHMSGYIKKI